MHRSQIFELKGKIALINRGEMTIGNYYARFRGLWQELALYSCIEAQNHAMQRNKENY